MPVLDTIPPRSRVLIIRLRSLGDCVLTTPAIHLLKRHRPDLELGVVVEDRFRAVFEGNPDISAILEPSVAGAAMFRAELTINFHGGTRSALLTGASASSWRVGFGHFRKAAVYNVRVPRAQAIFGEERVVHTAEHMASAMFFLGVPKGEIPRAFLRGGAKGRRELPYAVIHPMASSAAKTWPAERFVELGQYLRDSAGLDPLFIGAAGDDLAPFEAESFCCLRGAPLGEVMSLISDARLFVGNDSGPAHMAAAFGVPSLVLFGDSDPRIWAPWRTPSETIEAGVALHAVGVDTAIAAIERLPVRMENSRR
ncbi:MAG: glycosyltransferase family 9 protein [Bryobacteraceae bacterium]